MRRAVQAGIDYRGLVAGLSAQPATSLFPSYAPYAIYNQVSDPATARAALDAGWAVGPGGIRTKAGRRLSFSYLWSPNESPLHGDLGLALQQQLKAIGADVRITQVEDPYDNAAKSPDWGISVVSVGMEGIGAPANTMTSFLASSGGGNLGKINDPHLDSLLTQLNAEADPHAQRQLMTQIQQVIATAATGSRWLTRLPRSWSPWPTGGSNQPASCATSPRSSSRAHEPVQRARHESTTLLGTELIRPPPTSGTGRRRTSPMAGRRWAAGTGGWLLARAGQGLLTVWGASVVVFAVLPLTGDPVDAYIHLRAGFNPDARPDQSGPPPVGPG